MPLKYYKPTTPSRRLSSVTDYKKVLTPGIEPLKRLLLREKKYGGRNRQGRITVRHRGGGARKLVRIVDFSRLDKLNIPARIETVEYDPTRSAFISRIAFRDGEKRYMLAPEGLRVGEKIIASRERVDIKTGNRMPLLHMPIGTFVHDIEMKMGAGGKIARSAGSYAEVQGLESGYAFLKMPSGEIRKVREGCMATIGQVSNVDRDNVRIGKAGRLRHMGRRPEVRGKAMNPVDHPHGGGEGHNPIGMKHPKTPWGRPALGVRTRGRKWSDRFIVRRRKK